MGLIKKPAEITAKTTATILIYGQPGMGKTTLACSAEKPVLFDFDGGVSRIKAEHRVDTLQVSKWDEVAEALAEVRQSGEYRTIVIDTIGKMLDCIVDYIKRTQPNMVQRDGTLSLKGYGVRKNIWKQFLSDISQMGMSVYFVGHEKEEKHGDDVVKRADAGNATTANDLFKDLDLIGYLSANGKKRTLDFEGSSIIYAKAPTSMRKCYNVDSVVDAQGNTIGMNDYFQRVVMGDYKAFQASNDEVAKEYNRLVEEITDRATQIDSAEAANEYTAYVKETKHIYDSLIIARRLLNAKVQELGLTYNQEGGKFEGAEAAESKKPAKRASKKRAEEAEQEDNTNGQQDGE